MRLMLVAATALAFATPAAADWQLKQERDRMTDKVVKWATVTTQSDQGVTGTLILTCLASDLVGGYHLNLRTSQGFTRGQMGLRYRIDTGTVQERVGRVNTTRNGMDNIADLDDVRDAQRIRVEIFPAGAKPHHFDFNATGMRRAFEAVPCRNTRRVDR